VLRVMAGDAARQLLYTGLNSHCTACKRLAVHCIGMCRLMGSMCSLRWACMAMLLQSTHPERLMWLACMMAMQLAAQWLQARYCLVHGWVEPLCMLGLWYAAVALAWP
jgi:hypothetical protein